MLPLLLLFLVVAALLGALLFFLMGRALAVPPLEISIGFGPRLFDKELMGTQIRVHLLPMSSWASWRREEERAEKVPGPLQRVLLVAAPPICLALLSLALLGPEGLGEVGKGIPQVLSVFWPFGEEGVALISAFDRFQATAGFAASSGLLAAKMAAATLIVSLLAPFLYNGVPEDDPKVNTLNTLSMLFMFVPILCAIGAAINLIRYFL